MIITITICGWCKSLKPLKVEGIEEVLKPGRHKAEVWISHGMCMICETKFSSQSKDVYVSQNDTLTKNNTTGKRKSF